MVDRIVVAAILLGAYPLPLPAQDPTYTTGAILESGGTLPNSDACGQLSVPRSILESDVSGTLRVEFVVGADGGVAPDEIAVTESPHPELTELIQVHVLNCEFVPGTHGAAGTPVRVLMRVAYPFGSPTTATAPPTPSSPRPAPPAPSEEDLRRVHVWSDPETRLTAPPQRIHCPRYDPQARATRSRAADRYTRSPNLDRLPPKVEAVLELVIGTDGSPERRHSRVKRTTDRRLDESLLDWAQSCRWEPGRLGDTEVRVQIDFPVTMSFTRGDDAS